MYLQKHKRTLIIIATVLLTSLGGWTSYNLFIGDLTKTTANEIEAEQVLLTKTAANEIERYYADVQKRLEIMALMPVVRDAARSETCNQHLQTLLEANSSMFSNLGRIGKDGTFTCAVNRTIIGEPASKYGTYFDKLAKDPQHNPVMSQLIYPAGSGTPVSAIHVAVYDSKGQFNGSIGGAVYFDELEKRILLDKQVTPGSAVALFDNNGDILYHQDPFLHTKNLLSDDVLQLYAPRETITSFVNDVVKGSPGEGSIRFAFKEKLYHSTYKSAKVLGRHWTVRIAVPEQDVAQTVKRDTARQLFIGTIVIAVLAITTLVYITLRPPTKKPIGRH